MAETNYHYQPGFGRAGRGVGEMGGHRFNSHATAPAFYPSRILTSSSVPRLHLAAATQQQLLSSAP